MLFVFCGTQEFQWHVGTDFKGIAKKVADMITANADLQTRLEVQADGDEMEFISEKFRNLPFSESLIQIWYGDHARFIIGNMNSAILNQSFFKDHLVEEEA